MYDRPSTEGNIMIGLFWAFLFNLILLGIVVTAWRAFT